MAAEEVGVVGVDVVDEDEDVATRGSSKSNPLYIL